MEKQIQDLINNAEVRFCSNYGDNDDKAIYYHEDDIKALLQALVSGSADLKCECGRNLHIHRYCNVCDNDE